jgi:hypothetical protein
MSQLVPSSNVSNDELFRVNGCLPADRVEQLLSNGKVIDHRDIVDLRHELRQAKDLLAEIYEDLDALRKSVRGDNVRKVGQIMNEPFKTAGPYTGTGRSSFVPWRPLVLLCRCNACDAGRRLLFNGAPHTILRTIQFQRATIPPS